MWFFERKKSLIDSGLMNGSVDRHSHILFSVDDGVRELQDSLEILNYMAQMGVAEVWLTPHIMEDVPNTTERLQKRFEQLCESYNGPIKLHLAAEYMMDALLMKRVADRDILTMENNMVLIETSTWRAPEDWRSMLEKIQSAGYKPIFAHVERYQYLKSSDYDDLYRMGILMQLNYGSLSGFYGDTAQKKALELLEKGYYSFCGSDCHRFSNMRRQCESAILKKVDIARLAQVIR